MTVYRKDPEGEENFFDTLFAGIGHRGSSFSNVDGLVHDGVTKRFLMFEYKRSVERMSEGQKRALYGFSELPGCEFWGIRRIGEFFDVLVVRDGTQVFRGRIGWDALRAMLRSWWDEPGWIP